MRLLESNNSLERAADMNNLSIVDVPPDGDCLYHAVSEQLLLAGIQCGNYDIELGGKYLRESLLEYLTAENEFYHQHYWDFFKDGQFDQYLHRLQHGEWADNFAIAATANMLNIRINILEKRGEWIVIDPDTRISNNPQNLEQ